MRLCLTAILWVALGVLSPALGQVGFDRSGADFSRIEMRNGDPLACAARCEREGRCRAWAFNFPADPGADAVCWLKSRVPPRVVSSANVSGVRGAGVVEPRGRALELSIDRTGGDYRNMPVAAEPDGQACRAACEADNRCRAWTYVRPGYNNSTPHCYLKERVTPPRRKPCCVSGVVR